MRETLRLGQVAGVRVGVHWTVLVIFALILFGLSTAQLPLLYEGRSAAVYWTAGAIGSIAFFASLLAHEVSHAVVALRNGLQVDGIVLWLFGGVAHLKGEASDAGADLRIAGVGPLVSLLLGAVFGVIYLAAATLGVEGIALGVLGWLAIVNVVLAVFNLVPAAPLDGGRILRAVLWRRSGDRTSAAVSAARAGRFFGMLLIWLGIAQVIIAPGLGGLWLALIGWFLTSAARAEEQQAEVRGSLAGVPVSQVMTRDPVTVPPDISVQTLLDDYVLRHRCSAFPVVDPAGRPLGLVTLARIREVQPQQRAGTRVDRIAWSNDEVTSVTADEPVTTLFERFSDTGGRRALVLDDGQVIGIVSPTDISRTLEILQLGPEPSRASRTAPPTRPPPGAPADTDAASR